MASPVPPQQSGQPGRVIPGSGQSQSPRTPPTSEPPPQATEGGAATQAGASVTPPQAPPQEPTREQRLLASQEALIREQQQELNRLRQGQRGIEARVSAIESPPPSRDEQNTRFWKDPVGVVGELIQGELKRTVQPINEMLQGQRTVTEYDRMKNNLRNEYAQEWPYIEAEVDRFVKAASEAGNAITPELLNVAALAATGALHRGLLGNGTPAAPTPAAPPPAQPPTTPRVDMTTPPHLRPSAPPVPSHDAPPQKQLRALTENERRLARERGMSEAQFLDWIEVPPDQVVHSKIGREQPK